MTPQADTSTHHIAIPHDLQYDTCGACGIPFLISHGHECTLES